MKFRAHKNGKPVDIDYNMRPIARSKPTDPIPVNLIYGVDSESLFNQSDELKTVAIPYYAGLKEECLTYEQINKYTNPFESFLDVVFSRHAEPEKGKLKPSNTKIRGDGYGHARPGRRGKVPFILLVWYNLEYDISRMFAPESNFWRGVKTGHDGVRLQFGQYEMEIRHHLLFGSAPHFDYIFRHDGYILEVKALDMWGYWKGGLDNTAKALGVEGKAEVDTEIFSRKLETLTPDEWQDLYKYAKQDANTTREIYLKTAELLSAISMTVFCKGILPPSAPKAAARICFGKLEREELDPAPINAIQHALNGYHGGYVYAMRRGYLENVSVIDRKSAYPTILKMLPNPETVTYTSIRAGTIFKSLIGKVGFVVASFMESNRVHPCASLFGSDGRTLHPYGTLTKITISIPELAVGVLTGSVTDVVIHSGFYLKGETGGIFYDFIDKVYELKNNSESKSPMYTVAKLLMNALYGKLIEIHDLESPLINDSDFDLIVPDIDNDDYKALLLEAYANEDMQKFEEVCEDFGRKFGRGKLTTFGQYLSSDICTVGNYFTPVYASLVTALQRAWVVLVSRTLDSVAGDTDSIFTQMDINGPIFKTRIIKADILARQIGIGYVREGSELGDYEVEIHGGNGWLSGIKQYWFYNPNGKPKCAHHTLIKPDLDFSDLKGLPKKEQGKIIAERRTEFFRLAIKTLSEGQAFSYVGASSPVKLKTSLQRGKDFGVFEKQARTINAKHDNRLNEITSGVFEWKSIDEIKELLE